jgi:hypothetical protein
MSAYVIVIWTVCTDDTCRELRCKEQYIHKVSGPYFDEGDFKAEYEWAKEKYDEEDFIITVKELHGCVYDDSDEEEEISKDLSNLDFYNDEDEDEDVVKSDVQ